MFDIDKTRMIGLGGKNYDDMLSCFRLIPECHGQTDRIATSISHVSVLTRDKNHPRTLTLSTHSYTMFQCV